LRNETEASKTRGRRREQVQRRVSVVAVSEKRMLDLAQILPINQSINQSINLLGNKGPKATYKSQNTIYNNYRPRQCIQYIKNRASEKQFTNYIKFSLQ